MEQFSEMLGDKKNNFELHKAAKDSQGNEKYLPCDKEVLSQQTKLHSMATDVAAQIID